MGDTSHLNTGTSDSAVDMKIGILIVDECSDFVERHIVVLLDMLRSMGCTDGDIVVKQIPSISDTVMGVQFFAEYTDVDAVIVLGCVVQGDTRHFDFICQGVTQGITQLQLQWNMPVAFGVLTVNDMQQALDRCGGRLGNKGDEAAATAINMVKLQVEMDAASPDREPDRRNIN